MEKVEAAKRRCEVVIERISSANINHLCKRTLFKLATAELSFLSRLSLPDAAAPLSVNIGHLEAVLYILQQPFITAVSRVCKPLSLSSGIKNEQKIAPSLKGIHVDVVCTLNKTPVWIIVSDRNPKYVSWHEGHKSKGLKWRIEQVLVAARSTQTLRPSSIILFFSNGLVDSVREKLEGEFGALELELKFTVFDFDFDDSEELEGEWVNVLVRSYKEACVLEIEVDNTTNSVSSFKHGVKDSIQDISSPKLEEKNANLNMGDSFCSLLSSMKFCVESTKAEDLSGEEDVINFDTTALIAIVSGISNGSIEKLLAAPECKLRQRFKGNYEFVIEQVMSEIKKPIHAELNGMISGMRGMICESVLREFKELISMCGGPTEKFRADHLLKCLMVVPDSPSERMMELPTTRKLALKNKIVFGSGDYWHAPTLTANMAFVRAVAQTGMSLFTLEHRPRALTGD
ncbi:hypothetical protein SLE2022_347530 [Rubroshorea leprosula]